MDVCAYVGVSQLEETLFCLLEVEGWDFLLLVELVLVELTVTKEVVSVAFARILK